MAFQHKRTFCLVDDETGEEVTITDSPNGNYILSINGSGGEIKPEIFEELISTMKAFLDGRDD